MGHIKCTKTVLTRAFHMKEVFISDKTRNTCMCLLRKDTHMQTHKGQSNAKAVVTGKEVQETFSAITVLSEPLRHASSTF